MTEQPTNTLTSDTTAAENLPKGLPSVPRQKVDLIDYLLFVPFVICFVGTLLVFDIAQRIAILFGQAAHARVVTMLNFCLRSSLGVLGTKIEVINPPLLDAQKSYVIVSNHQSLFDIPILHTIFRSHSPKFVAKVELAKGLPSVSFNLRNGGNAIIDRSNPRQAIPEIERFGALIAKNHFAAVIFPEGTRARDGKLKPFRPSGMTSLFKAAPEALIIPVTLDGSWKLATRKFGPIPRGVKLKIVVGGPISQGEFSNPKELVLELHRRIEKKLGEIHS